jgi:CYTH domain-containing protein
MVALEIERKWIGDPLEIAEMIQHGVLEYAYGMYQCYLVNTEGFCIRARRIYKYGEELGTILTVKTRVNDMVRHEVEHEINGDAIAMSYLPVIAKTRYKLEGFEIDVFSDDLRGLVLVEREYESVEEAQADEVPYYCLDEVTEDPRYINANLLPPVYVNRNGLLAKTVDGKEVILDERNLFGH